MQFTVCFIGLSISIGIKAILFFVTMLAEDYCPFMTISMLSLIDIYIHFLVSYNKTPGFLSHIVRSPVFLFFKFCQQFLNIC